MRPFPCLALLVSCSCVSDLRGAQLQPNPVRADHDAPLLPVELPSSFTGDPLCSEWPPVTVIGWGEAVKRSLRTLGTPIGRGRPGILVERMEPFCATSGHHAVTQVRYRARLFGASGEELAATNGIADGIPLTPGDWEGSTIRSLSVSLELATQQAISPLLERNAALSPSTTR